MILMIDGHQVYHAAAVISAPGASSAAHVVRSGFRIEHPKAAANEKAVYDELPNSRRLTALTDNDAPANKGGVVPFAIGYNGETAADGRRTNESANSTRTPANNGEYGVFTDLVNKITTEFSQENSDSFRNSRERAGLPPFDITPYDQWQVSDFVKLHDTFPNAYAAFVGMYNAVAGDVTKMTPAQQREVPNAIKAMKTLSGDGDWVRYATMIGDSVAVINARP